ncbi:MAG: phosphotransferase [Bacteroidetes bacterium]|nr:phosphotransferase [Bacteroidota bacterium]
MMKLSLMKDVVEKSVNSNWDCELAKDLIKPWNHDEKWVKYWRASANFVCFFKYRDIQYVARFNTSNERTIQELDAEINLLNYLDSKNVNIAKPVISNNNRYVEEQKTPYGKFYTVVFDYVSGKHLEIEDFNLEGFYKWGKSLGQMHQVMKEVPESFQIRRKTHNELFENLITKYLPNDDIEALEIERIKRWLSSLTMNKDNYGIIHYDFELDNLIWNDDGIFVIDFDDAIYSWFAADIAYALRDLFSEGEKINLHDEKFLKFIQGYREITSLPEDQIKQIPFFYKFHNFITYKKLERSIDLKVHDENPEWMNNLISKLDKVKKEYYQHFQESDIW